MLKLKKNKSFGGETCIFEHDSVSTKTKMKFSCFLPTDVEQLDSCIIWLSGLTCNEENFITKAGAQKVLAGSKTMILCPDTSPRGLNLLNEHESYDFGSGASFYVNATTEGYSDHYQMYDYIARELPALLKNEFKISKISLIGHSMGGHGAVVIGLREPEIFKSISAFAPILHPIMCPWGQKAFNGYLGENSTAWIEYDATELLLAGVKRADEIMIDQGLDDEFYPEQLLTERFEQVALAQGQKLRLRYLEGYDHSYYTIASFIEDHLNFHLKALS